MKKEEKEYLFELFDTKISMFNNDNMFSFVNDLLIGARKLSGRDLKTGVYTKHQFEEIRFAERTFMPFNFISILVYLIFLEILGSLIKKSNGRSYEKNANSIQVILESYSDLSKEKIKAIRALRNSLIHNFGLATKKDSHKGLKHKFILSYVESKNIVEMPEKEWNGDFSDKNENTSTTIYLIALQQLIENIFKKIKVDLKNDNLEFRLNDIEELKARFTYN